MYFCLSIFFRTDVVYLLRILFRRKTRFICSGNVASKKCFWVGSSEFAASSIYTTFGLYLGLYEFFLLFCLLATLVLPSIFSSSGTIDFQFSQRDTKWLVVSKRARVVAFASSNCTSLPSLNPFSNDHLRSLFVSLFPTIDTSRLKWCVVKNIRRLLIFDFNCAP